MNGAVRFYSETVGKSPKIFKVNDKNYFFDTYLTQNDSDGKEQQIFMGSFYTKHRYSLHSSANYRLTSYIL